MKKKEQEYLDYCIENIRNSLTNSICMKVAQETIEDNFMFLYYKYPELEKLFCFLEALLMVESVAVIKWEAENARSIKPCYIYLIRDNKSLHTKIGISEDTDTRMKSLKIGNPSIEVIRELQVDNARSKEQQLHTKYRHKNVGWEWFDLSDKDIKYIKEFIN